MKAPTDHILVTSDERFNDSIQYGTLTLLNDMASHNNVRNVKRKLEVAAVADNVADQVSVGDFVFVHFDAMLTSMPIQVNGMTCYRVCCGHRNHTGDVFAKEVDGKPVPLFGWALVEPDVIEESDIMEWFFSDTEENYVKKSRKSETIGTIKYIGDFKSNPKLEVGMKVGFHEDDAFENGYNDERLYTMKANRIMVIYAND